MSVPIEAKSFEYTPTSLEGKEGAPKFTIRYGTRRDRNTFQQEVARRGVVSHTDEDMREETLAEIKRFSNITAEQKSKMVDTATRYWAAISSLDLQIKEWISICTKMKSEDEKAELPPAPEIDFDRDEEAWITGIINHVSESSPTLCNMRADNVKREQITREIALSVVLVDVEGFELKRRPDGIIEIHSMIELQEWLGERSEELGLEFLESGDPYNQLLTVGFSSFFLPKETEKNFASPPPITSSPESSMQQPETEEAISSKASAKSKATPESNSPMPTSESSTLPAPAETAGDASNGQTVEE